MSTWQEQRDRQRSRFIKLVASGVVAVLLAIVALVWAFNSFARVDPGFIGVVRNGGPFDNRDFQRILTPADGLTNVGYASTVSSYPTTDRFDNVQPGEYGAAPEAGDDLSTDRWRGRTKDGQDIGAQGQWRYNLNTDPKVLAAFDEKFGTRTYAVPGTDERVRVSDSDQGMAVFIAGQLRPIQQEALRAGIGSVNGEQLDPSFVLLKNLSADPNQLAAAQAQAAAAENTGTFTSLSQTISDSFVLRANEQLGTVMVDGKQQPYLINARFVLQQVYPSPETQQRIEGVRSAVADLAKRNADAAAAVAQANGEAAKIAAEANGRKAAAVADADALVEKQRGYNACTTCAEIDKTAAEGAAQREANSGWKQAPQVYAPGFNGMNLPQSAR